MRLGGSTKRPSRVLKFLWLFVLVLSISQVSTFAFNSEARADTTFDRSGFLKALEQTQEYASVALTKPPVYSKSYLLMDSKTAEVLTSKSPDTALPIASTTKMTTAS